MMAFLSLGCMVGKIMLEPLTDLLHSCLDASDLSALIFVVK